MRLAISNSMRIWGGGENWSLTVARGLAFRGHSVVLICQPDGELRRRAQAVADDNLSVIPLALHGDLNPIGMLRSSSLIRRKRIQLVVCNLDREVRTLGVAARLSGGVVFVRRRGSDYPFKNKPRFRLTYRFLVDRVLVNSESTRRSILEQNSWMPPWKLFRIYNGIPVEKFYPSSELRSAVRSELGYGKEDFVIGMAGALLPRKRHLTLIRAASALVGQIPGLRLLILGSERDDAYVELLHREACELGVADVLDLHGQVSDMNRFYNAMDMFVMPSGNEGFGYAAAEAMAAGVVTVVSDASSLPEVLGTSGRTGFIIPLDDHTCLESIIRRIREDTCTRQTIAAAGRERVLKEFGLDRMIRETESFFASLLEPQ
jgi:glycosyltransferase involved in cell wall biosynthesis